MTPDLRVLHVSEVHWGGVVSLLRAFTSEQVRLGMDVHVLAPPCGPWANGVAWHDWSVDRGKPWKLPQAVRQLRRLVGDLQPDVIHLHSFVAGQLGRMRGALPRRVNPAVVYQPHAWSFDLYADRIRPGLVRAAERRAAVRTDIIVANCQDEIDQGVESGIKLPSHSLGVAVDVDHHHPLEAVERERVRAELGLTSPQTVVCLGRLAWQKGQDMLVAQWEKAGPPLTELILVGPGETKDLEAAAPTQWGRSIRWVGEQRDVRPWLWGSDLLVLPSRYETVALVVAEAMACGIPVVATAVNGARETLLDPPGDPCGAVVPLGDMASLLREVERRLDSRDLLDREATIGRRRAEDRFRPALVAGRVQDAYSEAITYRRARKVSR